MTEPSTPSERARWRPTVPTVVVVSAVLIALVAVSVLLVILFQQTTGPGEVLRDFAERLETEDCPGTYALLDGSLQASISEESWCLEVPGLAEELDPAFEIERVVLEGEGARVEVSGEGTTAGAWFLTREGTSWRVKGAGQAIAFPAA